LREERPDFNSDESTNFVYNPHRSQSIENQRRRLPIFENRDQVLYLLETHQFLILIGETGSGKSTQVPQVSMILLKLLILSILIFVSFFSSTQYLLESGWGCDGTVIAVTQPRRVAALSLAARVADEMGTSLGQSVGYSIRFDERISEKTKLKFVTDGMLLREMLTDPLLKK
jgi:HrpA-like RNA helicase